MPGTNSWYFYAVRAGNGANITLLFDLPQDSKPLPAHYCLPGVLIINIFFDLIINFLEPPPNKHFNIYFI